MPDISAGNVRTLPIILPFAWSLRIISVQLHTSVFNLQSPFEEAVLPLARDLAALIPFSFLLHEMDKPQKLDKRYYELSKVEALLKAKHPPGTWALEVGFTLSSICILVIASSQDANSPLGGRRLYPCDEGTNGNNISQEPSL